MSSHSFKLDARTSHCLTKTLSCMSQIPSQAEICKKFHSLFDPPGEDERVGVALSALPQVPLNALRHPRKKIRAAGMSGAESYPIILTSFSRFTSIIS